MGRLCGVLLAGVLSWAMPAFACRSAVRSLPQVAEDAQVVFVAHVENVQSIVPFRDDDLSRGASVLQLYYRLANAGAGIWLPADVDEFLDFHSMLPLDREADAFVTFSLRQRLKGEVQDDMLIRNVVPHCRFAERFEPGADYLVIGHVDPARGYVQAERASLKLDTHSSLLALADLANHHFTDQKSPP